MRRGTLLVAGALALGAVAPAASEPDFLSRQYTRCTNCHSDGARMSCSLSA